MAGWEKVTLDKDWAIHGMKKVVSDNLCNSHDAEITHSINDASYHKLKTITLTNGLSVDTGKAIRVKFDVKSNNASYWVYGRVYKNGAAVGSAQGTLSTTYVTKSEDIDIGEIAAGETLELWGKAQASGATIYVENWRLYYSNDAKVAATNS